MRRVPTRPWLWIPVEGDEARSGGERSVFREIEGAESVMRALAGVLEKVDDDDIIAAAAAAAAATATAADKKNDEENDAAALTRLEDLLRSTSTSPFAEFGTSRVKFDVDGASIDVDAATFGHTVVEVEVMCADKEQVAAAEKAVGEVAEKLGLRPLADSGGKLETYIRQKCPKHLEVLVAKGYLKP